MKNVSCSSFVENMIDLCTFGSLSQGLSQKLGEVKTPLGSPLLGLWLEEESLPAQYGYALQPPRQQK